MLKTLHLLVFCFVVQEITTFDHKLITAVRNGMERNLKYIDQNFGKMNEDCWLGVVLATGIVYTCFYLIF